MAKLKSISKSQRFRLACSAVFIFIVLAQFLRTGSPMWGAIFFFVASFLYFRRTANMLVALPLFTGAVISPLVFPHNLTTPLSTLFSLIIAGLLYVALGVKDLILIHRDALLEASAYVLSYVALLLFFMQASAGVFFVAWLYAVLALFLVFYLLTKDHRMATLFATLFGELIWIISWLPIGFLNSASLCFAFVLFAGDAVRENRISIKNTAILMSLGILIFTTSNFRL